MHLPMHISRRSATDVKEVDHIASVAILKGPEIGAPELIDLQNKAAISNVIEHMFHSVPPSILFIAAFAASALISMYSVRKILFITCSRKLYDIPDDTRKIHGAGIPSLGGIGIFIGFIMVACVFWPGRPKLINFFLPSLVLLFFTGIYDDLMNMMPSKKLASQLLASLITICFCDIRITSLYGILGIETLPYTVSIVFTTLACTLFINAFNFIDGIDGLACVLAIFYSLVLAVLFHSVQRVGLTISAICLIGATVGLLVFNFAPAKIYMGDTGSMMLGFAIFIFALLFIEGYGVAFDSATPVASATWLSMVHSKKSALLVAFSILFLPVADALRVFALRLSRGKSPLYADRTHLHYYLLDSGLSHSQSVLVILMVNLLIVAAAFAFQDQHPLICLVFMAIPALAAMFITNIIRQRKLNKRLLSPAGDISLPGTVTENRPAKFN